MKEEAVKKSKVKNISSKVQDKIELTDEELLDQILAKKKIKIMFLRVIVMLIQLTRKVQGIILLR